MYSSGSDTSQDLIFVVMFLIQKFYQNTADQPTKVEHVCSAWAKRMEGYALDPQIAIVTPNRNVQHHYECATFSLIFVES